MLDQSDILESRYRLNEAGDFIIADYNSTKPFSSFFPGIAGVDGVPMWVFYVNRGQCICSMGVRDKDHPIMEFQPANRALNSVTMQGFRTFLKFADHPAHEFYEPFQNHYRDRLLDRSQRMIISPASLALEEMNHTLHLKFTVEYYCVPQDEYAGLVRTLKIENLGSRTVSLEGLDGLPVIVPHGVDNYILKNMRRTIEAFVEVCNLEAGAPFFKARVEPADRPDVARITRGNFYVGFASDGNRPGRIASVVDPMRIFGSRTDFSFPERFLESSADALLDNQILDGQLPCAMGMFNADIPSGGEFTYCSIIGHAPSVEVLNEMSDRITTPDYIRKAARRNREIIDSLTQHHLLCSGETALNHYARQNFLDNAMRGGLPFTFKGGKKRTTLYLYSRKHGDLERDYNDFRLMPTNYSQGNGNFRDINQNRRSDLLFNPDIGEDNVEYFYNLIQLDGFNPLVLKETRFAVDDREQVTALLGKYVHGDHLPSVLTLLEESFTPGSLLLFFSEQRIVLPADSGQFLAELLDHCRKVPDTEHGEGFWTDHWAYNLDLLENYAAVYPDRLQALLFEDHRFTFYNNPYCVQPRSRKYVLWKNRPMQLNAVVLDEEKAAAIERLTDNPNLVRTDFGTGKIYRTTLFSKMLCLIVNKLASLDPEGVGVELEAGKPNWYDALNGLPGLMGSSINETLEIKRHILYLLDRLPEYEETHAAVSLFVEVHDFLTTVHKLLEDNISAFDYWDRASTARESFRERTRLGVSGEERTIGLDRVRTFFAAALKKLDAGIMKARDAESNTLFTYFRHEITDYEIVEPVGANAQKNSNGNGTESIPIRPRKFKQVPLPLFLEGIVHFLRCRPDETQARAMAVDVRNSELYDKLLKMYKVNASLVDQPMEIGRARVFSPGWLENESIWLHMEYKYMLELLRNGLYQEFFNDFKNVCIPFLKPDTYGRSILENSSFIVSSAHPNTALHGNGFVARLSGATAEFIQMLNIMAMGSRPFRMSAIGELQLCFEPVLPEWLFIKEARTVGLHTPDGYREVSLPADSFSFMFLGKIFVTYHNPGRKYTFGEAKVTPVGWEIVDSNDKKRSFATPLLSGDIAEDIRLRKVARINIELR